MLPDPHWKRLHSPLLSDLQQTITGGTRNNAAMQILTRKDYTLIWCQIFANKSVFSIILVP